jgi:MoaA/NifB/PqqE/SkfB family radical SAM enzyme
MRIEKTACFDNEEIRAIITTQHIIKDFCEELKNGKCSYCPFNGICEQMKTVFDEIITNGDYILESEEEQ